MTPRLLVVDDDHDVLKFLETALGSLGCEVLAVADSRQAAQRANRQKFDAVFLDAGMPHLDGFELTRRIRTSPSNSKVPIVMLTGLDDLETMRSGFKAGITLFLGKPIDSKKLQGLLRTIHGAMLGDRRRYARLPLRCAVRCKVGKNQFASSSLNISQGGMLLEGSGGLEVGQELDMSFSLSGGAATLNPRARVVRKELPDRMAVLFLELRPEDSKILQGFITGFVQD